jgi:hypothetical protein
MTLDARYVRVTIEQLLVAIDDRKAAVALTHSAYPKLPHACDPAEDRALGIDQTWDALDYLLECAGGPLEVVVGAPFVPKLAGVSYLTHDQVSHAASWLATVGFDELLGGIDPDNPVRDIYKLDLAHPPHQERVRESYDALTSFFGAAARHDEAMLIIYE